MKTGSSVGLSGECMTQTGAFKTISAASA